MNENKLIYEYLQKYFSQQKIRRLIEEFLFSEFRKLLGEIDLDKNQALFLCWF